MKNQTDRVLLLMAEDNIHSQKELAQKIKRAPSLISGYLKAESDINEAFTHRLQGLLGWSAKWIQTGSGPKRVNGNQAVNSAQPTNEAVPISFVDETDVTTNSAGMEFRELDNGMVLMTIPLVDEFAYASYPHGWKDPEYVVELPRYSIVLPKREKGYYRAFEVRGESMYDGSINSICYGDVAVGRLIDSDFWDQKLFVTGGTDYVIVTHDGIICKRITKHDIKEGIITCSSINPDKTEFPDFDVRLSEVYELYKIRKVDRDWNRR